MENIIYGISFQVFREDANVGTPFWMPKRDAWVDSQIHLTVFYGYGDIRLIYALTGQNPEGC